MRTLEEINKLTYKNILIVIGDYLLVSEKTINQITLLEFQQHIGSKLTNIGGATKEEQDDTIVQLIQDRI